MIIKMELKETKSQQMGIITMIAVAVVIIVGVVVFSAIDTSFNTASLTASAAASKGNVTANTYAGFNLVSVAPIILAAVVILGIVALLYMRTR